MSGSKELQVKNKQEVAACAEQARPGLVFTPDVDIFETERELTLLADMPGVEPGDIDIDLNDGVLTVKGDTKPCSCSEKESDVFMEFQTGRYYRRFSLSDSIDQTKIGAKLEDGVLRLTMPKAEKAIPRRISVAVA